MEIGLGAMNMAPDVFWSQTWPEWETRLSGYRKANGGGDSSDEEFTADDLAKLQEEVDAESAKAA